MRSRDAMCWRSRIKAKWFFRPPPVGADVGRVAKGNAYGVVVNAMIAVDAQSGACLGLVGGDVWTRQDKGVSAVYARSLEQRKFIRWSSTVEQAKRVLYWAIHVTAIADCKADITPIGHQLRKLALSC